MTKITLSLLSLVALSAIATADEFTTTDVEAKYSNNKSVEATSNLEQSLNAGFSSTTGNTKTLNVNGKYEAAFITTGYNNHDLKTAFDISAFMTKNNSVKENEEYTANLGLEQMLDNGWLGYAGVNWLRNPDFKNYDNKFAIGVGVGKELFKDATQSLVAKLGTSYNIEQYANTQPNEDFGALNEYLEYNNKLNNVSRLFFKIGSMQNFDDMRKDYEVTGVFGVNFAVGENVSLSLEEEVAYDNLPPVGFKKTDTKSIIRLGYHF